MSERLASEALRIALRDEPNSDPGDLAEMVRQTSPLTSAREVVGVVDRALARALGLGPLLDLLADEAVTEIMINGTESIWIEKAGQLQLVPQILSKSELEHLIERILEPLGLRVDRLSPIADARLSDGSRVHVVIPPLALDGPMVTIRRFSLHQIPLAGFGDEGLVSLISSLVRQKATLLIVGETGAGKTTLLNSVGASIDPAERIVVIEDTSELRLPGDHIVRLEARPANSEGAGLVTIRDLVKASLRMRPDRLVVGEVRGGEALDLLLALTSGHQGSLATCHAGSADAGLHRLATLAMLAGLEIPADAIARLVSDAIDVVIVVRRSGARRRVVSVAEVGPGLKGVEIWPRGIQPASRTCVVKALSGIEQRGWGEAGRD